MHLLKTVAWSDAELYAYSTKLYNNRPNQVLTYLTYPYTDRIFDHHSSSDRIVPSDRGRHVYCMG